jgi:hypothetical protein
MERDNVKYYIEIELIERKIFGCGLENECSGGFKRV